MSVYLVQLPGETELSFCCQDCIAPELPRSPSMRERCYVAQLDSLDHYSYPSTSVCRRCGDDVFSHEDAGGSDVPI